MKNIFKHKIILLMKETALFSGIISNLDGWYVVIVFIFLLMFILAMYALNLGKNIKISSKLFNIETSDKESIEQ